MRKEQEVFEDLAALCKSKGFAHVVAFFSFRDNLVPYKDELKGSDYAKLFSWERLIRTEVSTLIGLMLRGPLDLAIPSREDFSRMAEKAEALLKELHEAMLAPFNEIFKAALQDPNHPNPFASAEGMREPIFYSAESAYSFQYRDIAPRKYSRDADWLRQHKGFSIVEARSVTAAISDFLSQKAAATLHGLRGAHPDDWTVLPAFEFSPPDLIKGSGLALDKISQILDAFCCPQDGNPSFTSLTEFNASNAYPILKVAPGKYVLFLYVSLTEALYDTPFYWMMADAQYRETATTNRGLFTEDFSYERLEKVFGAASVYKNVDIWKAKGEKLGEIDVLVLFADRAIVVQAKSKKLTLAARKGNDLQLKADFKAAVQDACDQAVFCSEKLFESFKFSDAAGKEINIPKSLKKVHPLCVVVDHYPALTFQAQSFLNAKATPKIEKPLVGDVFWLDVVSEMLDSPLRFLSYLELRCMVGDNVLISHENVALAYHLKQNLWLGRYDFIQLHDDISADLDVAMAVRRDGINGQRTPEGILTVLKDTRIGRIISEIERRSEAALIGLGLDLLKLNGTATKEIGEAIDKIAKVAAQDGRHHDLTVGIGKGSTGLTVHCNNHPDAAAFSKLQAHCEVRKYSTKAPLWHGMVVRPDDAALRFGLMLEHPWKEDAELAATVENMPAPIPAKKLPDIVRKLSPKKKKIGRNERCICGSGKKYKKCCLPGRI
jgi:hypothetical protein